MARRYTKPESRAALLKAFAGAKKRLWDGDPVGPRWGQRQYICHALDSARWAGDIDWGTYRRAKEIVMSRLGKDPGTGCGVVSVEGYLASLGVREPSPRSVQEFRSAWLDALIEEFSA